MKAIELKLSEIHFTDTPTKTQLSNMCRDLCRFLNNVGAALIVDEVHMANEPQCGELLNMATKLKALADFIDNPSGQSNSGLAVPMSGPQPMPRRMQ